jgi:histone-lysine N-methyltransferase SETD2
MADDTRDITPERVDEALSDMKLEEDASDGALDPIAARGTYSQAPTPDGIKTSRSTTPALPKSESRSPIKQQSASQTPKSEYDEEEEIIGGDITVTVEPGKPPKLSRKQSQKVVSRPPPLFHDSEDVTNEASEIFQVIKDCIYGSKYMGSSEHDALDCDCSEEWRKYC